jgi:hypothetical protein
MVSQNRKKKAVHISAKGDEGSGLWDAVKSGVSNAVGSVKEFFKPNLKGYTNQSKKTLKEYGSIPIKRIVISRTPIMKSLDKVLSLVSSGKWDELKKKYGYEKFFHLALVCYLDNGKMVVVEKNETIDITTNWLHDDQTETMDVNMGGKAGVLTIDEMVENCRKKFSSDQAYFKYDAFGQSNCQDFALDCLEQSGISDADVKKFVYQDVGELVKELPSFAQKIAKGATDIGAWFAKITGKGRSHHGWRIQHIVIHKPITKERATTLVRKVVGDKDFKVVEKEDTFHFEIEPKTHFKRFRGKRMNDKMTFFFGKPTISGGRRGDVMEGYNPHCGAGDWWNPLSTVMGTIGKGKDLVKAQETALRMRGTGKDLVKAQETALRMRGTGAKPKEPAKPPPPDPEQYVTIENPYFKGRMQTIQWKNKDGYLATQKQKYENRFKDKYGYTDFDKMEGTQEEKAKIQYDFYDDERKLYEGHLAKITKDKKDELAKPTPDLARVKKMDDAYTKIRKLLNETNEVLADTKKILPKN